VEQDFVALKSSALCIDGNAGGIMIDDASFQAAKSAGHFRTTTLHRQYTTVGQHAQLCIKYAPSAPSLMST